MVVHASNPPPTREAEAGRLQPRLHREIQSQKTKKKIWRIDWKGTSFKLKAALLHSIQTANYKEPGEVFYWTTPALWASVFCQQQCGIYSKWWSLNNNGRIKGLKKSLLIQIKLTAAKLGFESKLYHWFFFLHQTGRQCLFTVGATESCLGGSCPTSTLLAA